MSLKTNKTTKNTLLLAVGLSIGLLATPSIAQVAPPPTKPAKEQPTYTPPAAKPAPQAQPQPQPRPQPKKNVNAGNQGDISDLPINVPYPKLAQLGPDGKILRLRQLPDILALRSNPNIGPKTAEQIMPIIYSRRYRFELMVIDNLDLYWGLTSGMIDNLDMGNIAQLGQIAEMLKPLVGKTSLSQELQNRAILSRVQGGMNEYIVREYKKMVTDEIQVLSDGNSIEGVMRFVLDDSLLETKIAYNSMLAESISKVSTLVDDSGATSEEAQFLRTLEKPLADNPGQQFIDLTEYDGAFRKLPVDEAMNIFLAMREGRINPDISPMISMIDVLHERKQVMKSGFNMQAQNDKGQTIYDSKKQEEARKAADQKEAAENATTED